MAAWIFLLIGYMTLVRNAEYLMQHLILKAGLCSLLWLCCQFHDSQTYRNMEMTRERINFAFSPRDMLLSLQIGFSFVRAAVALAILERASWFELLSETTAPRYLKLVTVPSFCPFTFITLWMPLALFVINLVFSALSLCYILCRFC